MLWVEIAYFCGLQVKKGRIHFIKHSERTIHDSKIKIVIWVKALDKEIIDQQSKLYIKGKMATETTFLGI